MDECHPLCVLANADARYQRRDAGADILTHDYGYRHAVSDAARH